MTAVLHWADYLVLAAFLVISLAIGVYHSLSGGRQRTTSEFIMANRSLGVIPTTISMIVSFMSSITLLGTTAEMYSYGSQYIIMMNVVFSVGTIIAAIIFVPWIYPLQLVSVNEYLEMRFKSRSVRIAGSLLSVVMGISFMGIAMYGPSISLQAATGLPISISIPVMATVGVTYTALGGMRAVVWTDVFQFGIMALGMLAVLIKGLVVVGSVDKVVELCSQEGRFLWANWSPDPTTRNTVWSFSFGYMLSWIKQYGLAQAGVQRYSATTSVSKARLVLFLNVPGLVVLNTIACLTGLIVFAYYALIRCDPLKNGDIGNMNQLLPYFVSNMFVSSPGFTGLFLAALYGAALSTVSSSLSGVAANLWEDVLQWKLNFLKESSRALLNRFLVAFVGVLATGVAFLSSVLPGTIIQMSMTLQGAIGGPLFGLFVLGGFTRFASPKGTILGCLFGLAVMFFLSIGSLGISVRHPTLPSLPLDGCPSHQQIGNYSDWTIISTTSDTFTDADISRNNYQSSEFTTRPPKPYVQDLRGLHRVFAISFQWYVLIGTVATVVSGCIFSLIFRDRKLEDSVDERLLFMLLRNRSKPTDKSSGTFAMEPKTGSLKHQIEEKSKI